MRQCKDCGAEIERLKQYCRACVKKRAMDRYYARKARLGPPKHVCKDCGVDIKPQKQYCETCRVIRASLYYLKRQKTLAANERANIKEQKLKRLSALKKLRASCNFSVLTRGKIAGAKLCQVPPDRLVRVMADWTAGKIDII